MSAVPQVLDTPHAGIEIVAGLRRVLAESAEYWAGYPLREFFERPAPDVWAPADQVRHLTKSTRAITVGFELPRLLLLLRFGIARRPSLQYAEFRTQYEGALQRGATAGRFAPRPLDASEQSEDGRVRLMLQHAAAVERLCVAVADWSEASLDRFRIPHPLLGKLTAREMAMFALLHNVHHVHVAERRRGERPVTRDATRL